MILPFSGSSAERRRAALGCRGVGDVQRLPTLWNRHATVPARLHQFAARRAALGSEPFFPFSKQAWTSAIIDRGDLCRAVAGSAPASPADYGPFADVPVLVLSGDLDANTDRGGRQAADQFRDGRLIEVPNVAHVPERASGCPAVILTNFIRRLQVGDISCLADIPPIPVE